MARHRAQAGLTLEDLAAAAGVHRTSISLVERGDRNVTVATASRIARALGVSVSDLIREAEALVDSRLGT